MNARDVLLWTGAGVSREPPCGLPLGDALTRTIVEATCVAGTWSRAYDYFRIVGARDFSGRLKEIPRLESVIEHLDRPLEGRVVNSLAVLTQARPNSLHKFFAEHLGAGGAHVTVNFDGLTERACQERQINARPLAVHGLIGGTGEDSLRVRTTRLAASLRKRRGQLAERMLGNAKTLVFAGYSGRDYFDVEPFFRELTRREISIAPLNVIWVDHCEDVDVDHAVRDWDTDEPRNGKSILRALRDCGASVDYRRTRTISFLNELAAQIGLSALTGLDDPNTTAEPDRFLSTIKEELDLSDGERIVAAAAFWIPIGVGPPVLELERAARRQANAAAVLRKILDARHGAYASIGFYRTAIALLKQLSDSPRRIRIRAAYQRIAGAGIRSGVNHRRALRRFRRQGDGGSALERGSAEIEYLFWYGDWRASRLGSPAICLRRRLEALLPTTARGTPSRLDPKALFAKLVDDTDYLDHHPHAIDQLNQLRERIPELSDLSLGQVAERHDPGAPTYLESDSLGGYINRERNRLKQALVEERLPNLNELDEHRRRTEELHDLPGYLKATLMMRSAGISVRCPHRQLSDVQWTVGRKVGWLRAWRKRKPGL